MQRSHPPPARKDSAGSNSSGCGGPTRNTRRKWDAASAHITLAILIKVKLRSLGRRFLTRSTAAGGSGGSKALMQIAAGTRVVHFILVYVAIPLFALLPSLVARKSSAQGLGPGDVMGCVLEGNGVMIVLTWLLAPRKGWLRHMSLAGFSSLLCFDILMLTVDRRALHMLDRRVSGVDVRGAWDARGSYVRAAPKVLLRYMWPSLACLLLGFAARRRAVHVHTHTHTHTHVPKHDTHAHAHVDDDDDDEASVAHVRQTTPPQLPINPVKLLVVIKLLAYIVMMFGGGLPPFATMGVALMEALTASGMMLHHTDGLFNHFTVAGHAAVVSTESRALKSHVRSEDVAPKATLPHIVFIVYQGLLRSALYSEEGRVSAPFYHKLLQHVDVYDFPHTRAASTEATHALHALVHGRLLLSSNATNTAAHNRLPSLTQTLKSRGYTTRLAIADEYDHVHPPASTPPHDGPVHTHTRGHIPNGMGMNAYEGLRGREDEEGGVAAYGGDGGGGRMDTTGFDVVSRAKEEGVGELPSPPWFDESFWSALNATHPHFSLLIIPLPTGYTRSSDAPAPRGAYAEEAPPAVNGRQRRPSLHTSLSVADKHLEAVIGQMEKRDLFDSTILMVTSDFGRIHTHAATLEATSDGNGRLDSDQDVPFAEDRHQDQQQKQVPLHLEQQQPHQRQQQQSPQQEQPQQQQQPPPPPQQQPPPPPPTLQQHPHPQPHHQQPPHAPHHQAHAHEDDPRSTHTHHRPSIPSWLSQIEDSLTVPFVLRVPGALLRQVDDRRAAEVGDRSAHGGAVGGGVDGGGGRGGSTRTTTGGGSSGGGDGAGGKSNDLDTLHMGSAAKSTVESGGRQQALETLRRNAKGRSAMTTDIVPTLLELAGVDLTDVPMDNEVPAGAVVHGQSLLRDIDEDRVTLSLTSRPPLLVGTNTGGRGIGQQYVVVRRANLSAAFVLSERSNGSGGVKDGAVGSVSAGRYVLPRTHGARSAHSSNARFSADGWSDVVSALKAQPYLWDRLGDQLMEYRSQVDS